MERIVYYKTASPYPNDFTKFCSLNGIEIDNNFLTLEGRDIKSIGVEGNYIVITLYNGSKIKGEMSSIFGGYQAGEGIDPDKLTNNKIIETNASLIKTTNGIEVQNVSIGSYNDGDLIPAGTSVQDIIKSLMTKVYDVEPVNPKSNTYVQVGSVPLAEYYEVGSVLTNVTVGIVPDSDRLGYFVGPEEWPTGDNPPRVQVAGCNTIQTRYYFNHDLIGTQTDTTPLTGYETTLTNEGEYTFGTVIEYGSSTVQALKSDGSYSDVTIPAGVSDESTISFKAAYKYYYGYIPMHPWSQYTDVIPDKSTLQSMNLSTGWCNIGENTVIPTMESSTNKQALVLVLPNQYKKIKYTEDSLHIPVTISERWINYNTFAYNNTSYFVYVLHSLMPVKYNEITFGGV